MANKASTPHVEEDQAHLGLFKLIWTDLDLFRLIQAFLISFGFIWAQLNLFQLIHHWQNFI